MLTGLSVGKLAGISRQLKKFPISTLNRPKESLFLISSALYVGTGWGRPYNVTVYVTVIKMAFKLKTKFFSIRLNRSHLTSLSRSRSIWFVDSECSQWMFRDANKTTNRHINCDLFRRRNWFIRKLNLIFSHFNTLYSYNRNKKALLSQRRPRDAPNIWVPWKVSRVLANAPGYFSRNL